LKRARTSTRRSRTFNCRMTLSAEPRGSAAARALGASGDDEGGLFAPAIIGFVV
jgi:hypothetical protein